MIAYLRSLIEAAKKQIVELEGKIQVAEEEVEKCNQLKPILEKIESSALCGYNALQTAGNSLNAGIKIGGVGQGEKILERSVNIQKLSSSALAASTNVQARTATLEADIGTWNTNIAQLNTSISEWEAEIARLEAEAAALEAAAKAKKNQGASS